MFEEPEREILIDEFVDLTLEFLTDGGIRDEMADALVDLCGLTKDRILDSRRLFFDVACAKFATECFPLLTVQPRHRLSDYDPFEREFLARESCDRFLRRAAEYFDAIGSTSAEPLPSSNEEHLRAFAMQVDAFLSALEEKGAPELGRLMLGRISQCLIVPVEDDVDHQLMLATLLVGTHFTNFWKSAATLKTLEDAIGVGSATQPHGELEVSLSMLMSQIKA